MSKLPNNLLEAEKLAKEFLKAVQAVRENYDPEYYFGGTKHTSKVRRVSMDLTRALAEIRKKWR